MWKYQLNDSTWTWVSGSNETNQFGEYGEVGVANASNVPGARRSSVGWFDSDAQEIWIFGGDGWSTSDIANTGPSRGISFAMPFGINAFGYIGFFRRFVEIHNKY